MSTNKPSPSEVLLRNPLSEVTRSERRTLLGASAVGIIIVKTGLVPSKISALGIEFSQADQKSLLFAIAAIITYFLAAFMVYAASDFLSWRLSMYSALREIRFNKMMEGKDTEKELYRQLDIELQEFRFRSAFKHLARPMSVIRAVFEFALPIIIRSGLINSRATLSAWHDEKN